MSEARAKALAAVTRNTAASSGGYLAYAQASMMLVESLMLTLIDHHILTKEQLVSSVEGAIATKRQMVADRESPEIAIIAAGILRTLANSLAAAGATGNSNAG